MRSTINVTGKAALHNILEKFPTAEVKPMAPTSEGETWEVSIDLDETAAAVAVVLARMVDCGDYVAVVDLLDHYSGRHALAIMGHLVVYLRSMEIGTVPLLKALEAKDA